LLILLSRSALLAFMNSQFLFVISEVWYLNFMITDSIVIT